MDRKSRKLSPTQTTRFAPRGFYILLALADGPAQGSEIWQRIVGDTMGDYLKHSSLYDELRRLHDAGLIEVRAAWGRQKEFELTEKGLRLLRVEVGGLRRVVEVAGARGL